MPAISVNSVEYSTNPEGDPVIHVFGRDDHGEARRLDVTGFRPYFYAGVASPALKALPRGLEQDLVNDYTTIRGEKCVRLYTKSPSDVRGIREKFNHHEADILFTNRFLIDLGIKSGISFEGEYCQDYHNIRPANADHPVRTCFVDIECSDARGWPDASRDPIICITCYDSFDRTYTSFVLVKDVDAAANELDSADPLENGCFDPDFHAICLYQSEASLLTAFARYIRDRDPDVLTGWNIAGFDIPYIFGRFDALRIPNDAINRLPGRTTNDRIVIKGRQIFDLLAGYKRMHLTQKQSYRLDAVASDELGKNKIHFTGKISALPISKLVEYNFVDVELCVGIDKKDEIVGFHVEIAKYVGCSLDRTLNSMPIIDMYILRTAHGRYVLPTKTNIEAGETFEGAEVFEPKKGVNKNVAVLDLNSLYPAIMLTGNMSPDTKDPKGEIVAPTGVRFRKHPDGLVREIQTELMSERKRMKDERNKCKFGTRDYKLWDMKQAVVKVLMNSYYGVSGSNRFRLYDRDIGASITAVGREILKHNKKLIESNGIYKVIFGDTDSSGVPIEAPTLEDTIRQAKDLEKLLNDSYPAFAKTCLNADVSYFSVKFEKLYARFFSGGKKKRYAGLLTWKEGKTVHEIDIVGYETKRSDSPAITRMAQKMLIEMVLNGVEYEEIRKEIRKIVSNYVGGKYSLEETGIPGGIQKALGDYANKDAQVRGAEYANKYLGANFGRGSKPKRVYVKKTPQEFPKTDVVCFEYATDLPPGFEIDTDLMIDKTLRAPLERIMNEGLGWNWNEFDPRVTTLSQWGIG